MADYRIRASTGQFLLLGVSVTAIALASCAEVAYASQGAISQGYQSSTTDIAPGTLLSLEPGSAGIVQPSNTSNATKLVGVASPKPLVELSNNSGDNVQAVVSGTAQALVSNINGTVTAGDKITASPISGIGMKATSSSQIVGTAQANLNNVQTVTQSARQKDGKTKTVEVGLLPIAVNVAYYVVSQNQGSISTVLPPFLQNLANAVSGKQVSPLRVLIGALALIMGFLTGGIMLYSSIRANIASIGRNPLAQSALRKGFVDVVIATVGLLVITVGATYVVLAT